MSTIAPLQRASLDQPYTFLWTVTKLRVLAHHLLDRCREARLDPERSDAGRAVQRFLPGAVRSWAAGRSRPNDGSANRCCSPEIFAINWRKRGGNPRGTRMAEGEILTLRELADYLKLTERTLYGLTQHGRLPVFKVGNSWRFRLRDIDAWIESQKAEVRRDGGRR